MISYLINFYCYFRPIIYIRLQSLINQPITLLKSLKKTRKKCQRRLQIFSRVLISRDKNFILLLASFGLIFTFYIVNFYIVKLTVFLSLYPLLFPVALEHNLILSQESWLIFYIPHLHLHSTYRFHIGKFNVFYLHNSRLNNYSG